MGFFIVLGVFIAALTYWGTVERDHYLRTKRKFKQWLSNLWRKIRRKKAEPARRNDDWDEWEGMTFGGNPNDVLPKGLPHRSSGPSERRTKPIDPSSIRKK